MRRSPIALLTLVLAASPLSAQSNPFSTQLRADYTSIRDYFVRAAEEMPESSYTFKPSPDVRSFAQQIAHVADDQYNLCMPAKGETRNAPYQDIEQRLSTKAELVAALKQAFAYCDGVYSSLTDANGTDKTPRSRNRFGMLNWNLWHTWEHYGNIVVYLRMNHLIPPSSQPR